MARVQYKSTPGGILQRRNGDAWEGVTVTHSGGTVYAEQTGATPYGGPLTTNIDGEVPGWLDLGVYTTTNPVNGKSVTFEVGGGAGDLTGLEPRVTTLESDGGPVKKAPAQTAELTYVPVFDIDPKSTSAPKFSVYMNSAANTGAGAGSHNRGVWFGFNAGRYLGGTFETGKQGVYMGFEDNFYDAGGDETYGVEWYVGYTTPDGSTIAPAGLRPFYFRVKASNTNTSTKEVIAWVDVGAGAGGNFSVMGSVGTATELFIVHKALGIFNRLPAYFTADNAAAGGAGTIQIAPADGYAQMDIVAPGTGVAGHYGIIAFKDVSTYVWTISAASGEWYVTDNVNGSRKHLQFLPGATDLAAQSIFKSTVKVMGATGLNGNTPVGKASAIASPSADAASLKTAVDAIRVALQNIGITA